MQFVKKVPHICRNILLACPKYDLYLEEREITFLWIFGTYVQNCIKCYDSRS